MEVLEGVKQEEGFHFLGMIIYFLYQEIPYQPVHVIQNNQGTFTATPESLGDETFSQKSAD